MGRCRRADAQMRQSTAHYGPTMGSDYFLRQYNNENRAVEPRDLAATFAETLSVVGEGSSCPGGSEGGLRRGLMARDVGVFAR